MAWVEERRGQFRVRFRREDDTVGSVTGIPDLESANNEIQEIEVAQRKGTWVDPSKKKITLAEWVLEWWDALDVDKRTLENYQGIIKNHILPRWGDTEIGDISNIKVLKWLKEIRDDQGRAQVTVDGIKKLLSLILSDAAVDNLIPSNPIQARRRGRRSVTTRTKEQIWAEPHEVLRIADQAAACYSFSGALLIVTAAWTGARWGELTGLQRPNLHLFDDDTGFFTIDPAIGALHESNRGLWLGPPKTADSARDITLPPFLVRLLRIHLKTQEHRHVFTSLDNALHRRSNFSRRATRPAADGNLAMRNPPIRLQPIKPGLKFHGLRHGHKTWMIEDLLPEVVQERRLGHKLPDKIAETYSHVGPQLEALVLTKLQQRWDDAVAEVEARSDNDPAINTLWRLAA
jgi:integrase